jgi:hypothetical protein
VSQHNPNPARKNIKARVFAPNPPEKASKQEHFRQIAAEKQLNKLCTTRKSNLVTLCTPNRSKKSK